MVTAEEIPDAQALCIRFGVSDHPCRDGTTAAMIVRVAEQGSCRSQLLPGDITNRTLQGMGKGDKITLSEGEVMRPKVAVPGVQARKIVARG